MTLWGTIPVSSPQVFTYIRRQKMAEVGVEYRRPLLRTKHLNLQYTAGVTPLSIVRSQGAVSWGGGFSPFGLQFNLRASKKVQPFFDSGIGYLLFNKPTPIQGAAQFNYFFHFSGGVELNTERSVKLGARFQHFSNGDAAPRNPGLENIALYLGYSWTRPSPSATQLGDFGRDRFDWGSAITQSLGFLAMQHSFRLAVGPSARQELATGNYFGDWFKALKLWSETGWNDGDTWISNYPGHAIEGAIAGYIQIQNDPRGREVEFSWSRAYWRSRAKATAFAAAYSLQYELGPLGETSIGNLGKNFYINEKGQRTNGMGQVDLVMTPILGLGWMVGEDFIDHTVIRRLEKRRSWVWKPVMSFATPSRSMANVLRFKKPWYRDRLPHR